MTRIIGRTLAALAAAGLLVLPACGDEGDEASTGGSTTEAPTTSTPDRGATTTAVAAAFCDAVFGTDAALHGADAAGIAAVLDTLDASAPDELRDAVETVTAGLRTHVDDEHDDEVTDDTGMTDDTEMSEQFVGGATRLKRAAHDEPGGEGMPSEEYLAAYADIESWVSENCGVATLEVTGEDYAYEGIPDEVAAGRTVVHFDNTGDELHEIEILRLNDDATASVEEILGMDEDEAMTQVTDVAGVHVAPGDDGWTSADLTPGSYIALCFVTKGSTSMEDMEDMVHFGGDMDAEPHFTLGMIREFTVT
jgi:hypothetical protein